MESLPRSPLDPAEEVIKEGDVAVPWLVGEYSRSLQLNIARLIPPGCETISLFKGARSGFRFYGPPAIIGDALFYSDLQKQPWYYTDDKWEFREALALIPRLGALKILEIGSGQGAFLRALGLHNPFAEAVGLELNGMAAAQASAAGLNVTLETTSAHAQKNAQVYDVVATFQVLEHIPNPAEFLHDAVKLLKPGGLLILGVPDNSQRPVASIFLGPASILNMPPHHQGLWDVVSLAYLTKMFPLDLHSYQVEPAESRAHWTAYRLLLKNGLRESFGATLGALGYLISRPFFDRALATLRHYLPAHSALAVYKRRRNEVST